MVAPPDLSLSLSMYTYGVICCFLRTAGPALETVGRGRGRGRGHGLGGVIRKGLLIHTPPLVYDDPCILAVVTTLSLWLPPCLEIHRLLSRPQILSLLALAWLCRALATCLSLHCETREFRPYRSGRVVEEIMPVVLCQEQHGGDAVTAQPANPRSQGRSLVMSGHPSWSLLLWHSSPLSP